MTTVPVPSGLAMILSIFATDAASMPNRVWFWMRYCRAAASGSAGRPVAMAFTPFAGMSDCGVPKAFQATEPDFLARLRWVALGAAAPARLSLSRDAEPSPRNGLLLGDLAGAAGAAPAGVYVVAKLATTATLSSAADFHEGLRTMWFPPWYTEKNVDIRIVGYP